MKLSTAIEHLNNGNSVKFSKKERPVFQLQKKEDFELITFNYLGQRKISSLKKSIYTIGSFLKIDKKGLKLLDFAKKEIKEITEYDLYNKKYEIKVFKRPIRKSEGAKPINDKLEEYFIKNNHSFQSEFRTYARGVRAIADYVSIQNEEFITYEVKSDVDSFIRLEKQIKDYKKYSDRIYIVLHHKKEDLFRKNHNKLLKYCGLIIFEEDKLILKEEAPKNKTKIDFNLLIYKEKVAVFSEMKGRSKIKDKKDCFETIFDKETQKRIILGILKDRFNNRRQSRYDAGYHNLNLSQFQDNLNKYLES